MRDYGKVHSRIWESADFRALSEDGRSLALYLLTCQHGTIAGVFRVPDGYACEDLQWSAERVSEGFRNLHEKGFATRCDVTKWVVVWKFMEWNPPENPNQRKAAAKQATGIPDACGWKADFLCRWGGSVGVELPTPPNPLPTVPEPLLNQEQKQEQKTEAGTEDSANAGGKPPKLTDPKEIIFGFGLTLLVNAGTPEKQARSFLGGRVKEYDEAHVIDALRDCAKAKPLQPLEWLAAALPPKAGKGSSKHAGFSGKNYREGVSADGSFN